MRNCLNSCLSAKEFPEIRVRTQRLKSRVLLVDKANPGGTSPVQPQPENSKKHKTIPAPHPGFGCASTSQVQVHGYSQLMCNFTTRSWQKSDHSIWYKVCTVLKGAAQGSFQFCFLLVVQLRDSQSCHTQQGEVRNTNKSSQVSWRWGQPLPGCGIHLWAMQWMSNKALNQQKCLCSELLGARAWVQVPSGAQAGICWPRRAEMGTEAEMGPHIPSLKCRELSHQLHNFPAPKQKHPVKNLENSWQKNLPKRFFFFLSVVSLCPPTLQVREKLGNAIPTGTALKSEVKCSCCFLDGKSAPGW